MSNLSSQTLVSEDQHQIQEVGLLHERLQQEIAIHKSIGLHLAESLRRESQFS